MIKKYKHYIPLVALMLGMVIAIYFDIHKYFTIETLRNNRLVIEESISTHPFITGLLFCFIYIVSVGLSLPGSAILTVIGGYSFGYLYGTIYVVISATLGASIVFLSTRMASEQALKDPKKPWLKKMQHGFLENAWSYLITLRLIPIFPFFAVNIAAAIFRTSFVTFFWGTFIGIIPGSFIYASIGVTMRNFIEKPQLAITDLMSTEMIALYVGMAILIALPILYQRNKSRKNKLTKV